jgi:hypothetical protein
MAFAAVLLVVATPASPAAAISVDAVGYSAQACTMVGDGGADSLGGKGDRDVVCGRGGTDRIRGNGGHDVLLGGGGGDLLQGKTGSDLLNGGPGNDRAFGGAGADDLQGGPGIDGLGGGLGPDELSGGAGRDIVLYGQRGQSVRVSIGAGANDGLAGEGDDVHADVEAVQGGRGNDVLTGNGRSNRLFGGGGKDRLLGKGGSDVLIGGGADDRLDARERATATGRAAQAGSVDRVACGGGNDTALVDPVDVVDPDCENVVGGVQNRPPTGIALSNTSVAENQPAGTAFGTLSAGDPDPSDTHSFALVPGAGSTDNGSFQIVENTLRTNAVFNHEAKSTYSVRIRATDHGTPAGQIVREFTIAVTNVNEGPTVDASGGSAAFTEGTLPVAVDPEIVVADPDSELSGATVKLPSSVSDESLGFVSQSGITGTYDAGAATLTLSGAATVGQYQAVLRSVTYFNADDTPSTAPRTVTFDVTDAGGLTSTPDSRDVTVAATNDAPVVTASAGATPYTENGAAVVVDGALAVADPDDMDLEGATVEIVAPQAGDQLLFTDQSGITGAGSGTASLTLTGAASEAAYQDALRSITFSSANDDPATTKSVEFTANDGDADNASATKFINITPDNDAPTLDTTDAALPYPEGAGPVAADPASP